MCDHTALIEHFCLRADLSTYDPYDIWKTRLGYAVKDFYNCHRVAGLPSAATLALFDNCINNRRRMFYSRLEYPVVRAMAALALLSLYRKSADRRHLDGARRHLDWLVVNCHRWQHGIGWGLPFAHAVSKTVRYGPNTPFSTITPYCLEAMVEFEKRSGTSQFRQVVEGIYPFFERDLVVMEDGGDYLITSYGPLRDRIVVNAVSYTMYSYALLLPYLSEAESARARHRIRKLYRFVQMTQQDDGSWYYCPNDKGSFIDCFHSCIVLKNVIKTNALVALEEAASVVESGYAYLQKQLLDPRWGLFRRFAVANKRGLVRFDLYDNAEMLNLAALREDLPLAERLAASVRTHFCEGRDVYSQIDLGCRKRSKNTLRWAVMPYVYAVSQTL
ncbi:MAG: hypothetical protein JXB62_13430 [Pirellulales bacterium]|nr:hypothetical protein [Pirellulales bacterium]